MLSKQSQILYDYILSSRATTVEVNWLIFALIVLTGGGAKPPTGGKMLPLPFSHAGGGFYVLADSPSVLW